MVTGAHGSTQPDHPAEVVLDVGATGLDEVVVEVLHALQPSVVDEVLLTGLVLELLELAQSDQTYELLELVGTTGFELVVEEDHTPHVDEVVGSELFELVVLDQAALRGRQK